MYYIQKDIDGYVRDVIGVPRENYKMFYYPYALPKDIYAGYYKIVNDRFVVDEAKKEEYEKEHNKEGLEARVQELEEMVLFLSNQI